MAELSSFNWLQNGGPRNLEILALVATDGKCGCGPGHVFRHCIKFGANICNNGPVRAKNENFNMAITTMLKFIWSELWWQSQFWDQIVSLSVKFVQYWPSYHLLTDFQNSTDAILDFVGYQYRWGAYSRCLYHIWCESVQKWLSSRHLIDFAHLGFLHYVNFYGKSLCRTPFSALYQIQCKYVQYCPSSGKKVTFSMAAAVILDFVRYKFWQQSSPGTLGVSNKVDIGRFPLRYATLCCDISFDGYLHSSRLRNYGGRVHISLLLVQILSKKWQASKINSNLKNGYSKYAG